MRRQFFFLLAVAARASLVPLPLLLAFGGFVAGSVAAEMESRQRETIDGIRFDYAPAHAALARELAPRIATLNRENAALDPSRAPAENTPVAPLTVRDLRVNRADYLARIAACLGLEKSTSLQEDCYDAFLENFESSNRAFDLLARQMRSLAFVRWVGIFEKAELLRRVKAGEKVPGFTLDPDGEHLNFNWTGKVETSDPEMQALLAERKEHRLDYGYNLTVKEGVASLSGSFKPRNPGAKPPAAKATPTAAAPAISDLVLTPVVLKPEEVALPLAEQVAVQMKMLEPLRDFAGVTGDTFQNPALLVQLILHETTEVGIVERYLGSRDRRWLCEGVANYVAWKVARDRAGDAAARRVYDLDAQLTRHAALRGQIDLRKWPAVENQRKADADSPLNEAHYTFATRAIVLMAARHGEDFLPKLFREIGATPLAKTDLRTVEKAYRALTQTELREILDAAVAPLPAVSPAPR